MAQKTFISEILTSADVNLYLAGEGGAWTSWTPVVTQSGAVAVTNTRSRVARYGRLIHCTFSLSVTGTGTAANGITISLPVAAVAANVMAGTATLNDSSAGIMYPAHTWINTTTTMQLYTTSANAAGFTLGSSGFTAALASGDSMTGTVTYEAAS